MNFVLKLHLLFYISQIISLKKYLKLPPAPFIPQKNTSLHENPVRDTPSNFYVSKLHLLFYIFSIISLKEYLNLPPPLSRFMPQKNHLCTKILLEIPPVIYISNINIKLMWYQTLHPRRFFGTFFHNASCTE